jgi:hypothetical protein
MSWNRRPTSLSLGSLGLAATGLAAALGGATGVAAAVTDAGAGPTFAATVRPVDPATEEEMTGVSWKPGCPVPISDLRIIDMTHWGFDGAVHWGAMVVHEDVAHDVVEAFSMLYDARFPIRRMERVEEYDGSDDASMAADNTSAFNCRPITGTTDRFSVHSYGKAIDINTVENPYVKGDTVLPEAGREYLDRDDVRPGMIVDGDLVTKAFKKAGFKWGGDWKSLQDYQHFEAKIR